MKPGNVSSVSNNQAKWSNTQSKNFIINAVPVKNEVNFYKITLIVIYIYLKYILMKLYYIFRSFILKMEHIATRKCIIMIDIILAMKKQRDQHVEEQKDTEIKMHLKEHCMLYLHID